MKRKKLVIFLGVLTSLFFAATSFADVEVTVLNSTSSYTLKFYPQQLISKDPSGCADWLYQPTGQPRSPGQTEGWTVEHYGYFCGIAQVGSLVSMSVFSAPNNQINSCDIEVVGSGGGTDPTYSTNCDNDTVNITGGDSYSGTPVNPHYSLTVTDGN